MLNETLLVKAYLEHMLRGDDIRRRNEAGYSTEAVIWIALLAGLAIAVGGIIAVKVTSKANSISLN